MKKYDFFKNLFFAATTFILQLLASFWLPDPFRRVDVISVFIVLTLIKTASGVIVWLAFAMYFAAEMFSGCRFGNLLTAGTFSALISYWLYKYLFTNKSSFSVASVTFVNVLSYEIFFYLFLLISGIVSRDIHAMSPMHFLKIFSVKLIFSVLVCTGLHLASSWKAVGRLEMFTPR